MVELKILDDIKATGESNNKYLKFPDSKTFNSLVEIIKKAKETPAMLDEFLKGGEDEVGKNDAYGIILKAIDEALKTKEGAAKEAMEAEKAKLVKKLGHGKKVGLNFVLKFLLATNKYKDIAEMSNLI